MYSPPTLVQTLFCFCLVLVFGSVLRFRWRFWHFFIGFLMVDSAPFFNCWIQCSGFSLWVLAFERFSQVCDDLGLFLLLGLGFRILPSAHRFKGLAQFFCELGAKSSVLKNGFHSSSGIHEVSGTNILPCKWGALKLLMISNPSRLFDESVEGKGLVEDVSGGIDDETDVIKLRKLMKLEKEKANAAVLELEKERASAASAIEELMAKILSLECEKSSIEIRSNQNQRLAILKQQYDDEVIQHLKWIIMNVENQLELCGKNLESLGNDSEMDQFAGDAVTGDFSSRVKDDHNDVLVSSLERDLYASP